MKTDYRTWLKPTPIPQGRRIQYRTPLVDGPDVSWIKHCRFGDDQGTHSACSVFVKGNWAECIGRAYPEGMHVTSGTTPRIIHGHPENIPNADMLKAYLQVMGDSDEGMTFPDAWAAVAGLGWIRGATGIQMIFDEGMWLPRQPTLVGCELTTDWVEESNICENGMFRSLTSTETVGYHAMLHIGSGVVPAWGSERWEYLLSAWRRKNGKPFGWNGVVVLPKSYYEDWLREVWIVF